MNKTKLCLLLLCGLTATLLARQADAGRELQELIRLATQNNPEIKAQEASVDASEARVPQSSALEDPRIGFRATNLPLSDFGLNNTPMTGLDFSLSQKIPFPGKLRLRKKAEQSSASAMSSLYEETKNQIRYRVSDTYFQLYRIDKSIHVIRKNLSLLDQLAKAAEARYEVGEASGPDVFRSQTLRSEMKNDLIVLKQERKSLAMKLNTLLNRSMETPVRLKYGFKLSELPKKGAWKKAVEGRPLLRAIDAKAEEANHLLKLAKREYLPDFDFMVGYRLRGNAPGDPVRGSDFISGGVTLNIPLWAHWRQSKKVQESAAQKMVAKYQYESLHNESTYQAQNAHEELKRQNQQIKHYRSHLLPQSRATYESSLTAYKADQMDFFTTIEALKDRYEIERDYYILRSDYEISLARLKWILGSNEITSQEASQ